MPIAGLVLTLSDDPELQTLAFEGLSSLNQVTIGPLHGARLAVVTDTDSIQQQQELWNQLLTIPGVFLVDLAYHDFSDVQYIDSRLLVRNRAPETES